MESTINRTVEKMRMIREITLPGDEANGNGKQHHPHSLALCPHAVALGETVYGGFSTGFQVEGEKEQTSLSWLSSASWKTCLATKKSHDDDDDDDQKEAEKKEEEEKEAVSSPPRQQRDAHHVLISQIVSNADGSIIAVSSSQQQPTVVEQDGTGKATSARLVVTLLRGSDGQVLVTRQVASTAMTSEKTDTAVAAAARLSFVGDSGSGTRGGGGGALTSQQQQPVLDTLLIHVPGSGDGDHGNGHWIEVSGIHGQALNNAEPALVQQATRSIKVRTIELPTSTTTATSTGCAENDHYESSISSITGFFLPQSTNFAAADNDQDDDAAKQSSRMIRLVACDMAGRLSVYDHHNPSSSTSKAITCNLVQRDIVLQLDGGHSWKVDCNVGLIPQKSPLGFEMYLVCAVVSGSRLAIAWFDPMSLKSVCHFLMETTLPPHSNMAGSIRSSGSGNRHQPVNRSTDKSSSSRLKVLSIQPIQSCMDDSALAVAVAVRGSTTAAGGGGGETRADTTIHVLQAVVEDTMGLTILSKPHSVFKVPGHISHEQTLSASLSSPCTRSSIAAAPYSFLFLQQSVSGGTTCIAFCPPTSTSQVVGRVRLLLQEGDLEKANELLHAAGINSSISIPYATFHPSDVILKQLLHAASIGHGDVQGQVQTYLDQLVAGGSEEQFNILVKSVNVIMNCLGETVTADKNIEILSVLKSAVKTAIAVLPQSSKMVATLDQKNAMIDESLSVLQFLASENGKRVGTLATPLGMIQTPANLLTALVKERKFTQAGDVWRSSDLQSHIPPEVLVSAMLQISADVPPAKYLGLLHDVAMPSLTINHELLPALRAWCCRIADALEEKNDDQRNLNAAISLLETVHVQAKELQLRVHSSFSTFTPFVENTDMLRKTRRSPRSGDTETSRPGFNLDSSSRRRRDNTRSTRPVPSMLQLVGLHSRASKATSRVPLAPESDNAYEETEECVEEKLREALCLKEARQHGMAQDAVTLKAFSKKGGANFCAKELVRYFSTIAGTDHDLRARSFAETVEPFCAAFAVNYGETLLDYACDICKGMRGAERAIQEAASVARCCRSAIAKCRTTLAVLRAALLRGYSPPWLMEMSVEAIAWASCDTVLQSELEEAARLLLIDGIISKYCGNGARELFRVDNPRHAARLVQFVSRQIDHHTVLGDVISLCGAFTHLSSSDACSSIFQQAILSGDPVKCATLFRNLYDRDPGLARKTLVSAISFTAELLDEGCDSTSIMSVHRDRAVSACASACELLSTAKEYDRKLDAEASTSIDSYLSDLSLDGLHQKLLLLHELQCNHGVFLTLSDFSSAVQLLEAANQVFKPLIESYSAGDKVRFHTDVEKAKRACSLMVGCSTADFNNIWAVAATTAAKVLLEQRLDNNLHKFLYAVDMLDGTENEVVSRARLTVALELCNAVSEDAEGMRTSEGIRRMSIAASLLRNHGVLLATNSLLPATIALDAHLDTACQILVRSDEGHGDVLSGNRDKMQADAWQRAASSLAPTKPPVVLHVSQPALHPSWYIGDGLLLPPSQALSLTSWFCREMIREHATMEGGTNELYRLVADRGAHSLALRVLAVSTVGFLSASTTRTASTRLNATVSKEFAIELVNTGKALAERSLGGSVAGMTSGVIDSQLSVAFLLALPLKSAYKVYKSALPTAMKTRSFERIFILANIGKVTCSGCPEGGTSSIRPALWKRQEKFLNQCERLSTRAAWWHVLRYHCVEFDPNRFLDPDAVLDESVSSGHGLLSYVETLIYPFIASLMETLDNAEVLHLATLFADSFGLTGEVVLHKHIEYLLSPRQSETNDRDVRLDLIQCRRIAKDSLRALPPFQRCAVLRRCLVTLCNSKHGATDYERFSLVLSLYYEALVTLVEKVESLSSVDRVRLENEIEQIGRRRDAILILSSYFQGIRSSDRPNFIEFFRPLPPSLESDAASVMVPMCGVLGSKIRQDSATVFDPLRPLEKIIASSVDMTSTTALAPLWLSLGLPNGYIHARFLIARFESAAEDKTTLPSFENDVIPVLDRLRSSHDKAILAEWCGHHYANSDEDKRKCLEVSLYSAMMLSSELEQRRQHNPDLAEAEMQSLNTVKRITAAKEAIEDRLKVKHVLRCSASKMYGSAVTLIQNLIERLDERVAGGDDLSPEGMVDFLLSTGSQLAATGCLDDATTLSTNQLRQLSSTVHAACNALSERHSHIHPDQHAKRLAYKWLFFGVEATTADHCQQPVDEILQEQKIPAAASLEEFNEEDTINFVMDLDCVQGGGGNTWNEEGGVYVESPPLDDRRTSEEEPSALKAAAAREVSESKSNIAAIRIAFVLANTCQDGVSATPDGDENTCPQDNGKRSSEGKKRVGLLTQIGSKRESRPDTSMLLSQELLRVVFAKAGDATTFGPFGGNGQRQPGTERIKSVTFAMRHRALRAAAILCPQEALERVIQDEGYLRNCSLKLCSFGSFVAKEIEEMGLPLPHSDLGQLSTMHYSSYARALWRHHSGDMKRSKGRLLLLLLEMCLKEDQPDAKFVQMILNEMERLELSRTLLLAAERISSFKKRVGVESSSALPTINLSAALEIVSKTVFSELKTTVSSRDIGEELAKDAVQTVRRLAHVFIDISNPDVQSELHRFVQVIQNTTSETKHIVLQAGFQRVLTDTARRLSEYAPLVATNGVQLTR